MKKSFSNILNVALVGVVVIMGSSMHANGASYVDAGTSTDPLVTQGYVEQRLEALSANFEEQISQIKAGAGSTGAMVSFEVEEVQAGQIISLEANTQFILRAGDALAIGGVGGGLSDLTTGIDLKTDDPLEKNHLLLIPKSDGRAVKMLTHGWVMISGGYSIK